MMPDILTTETNRTDSLINFSYNFLESDNGKEFLEKNLELLKDLSPLEVIHVFEHICNNGLDIVNIKTNISKLTNIYYKPLMALQWQVPEDNVFMNSIMIENRNLEHLIDEIKNIIKAYYQLYNDKILKTLKPLILKIIEYQMHHIKIEQILHNYLKNDPGEFNQYLKVTESFHRDFSHLSSSISKLLHSISPDKDKINREIGKLCFLTFLMVFREEQVVFPLAIKYIPEQVWQKMLDESAEFDCFTWE